MAPAVEDLDVGGDRHVFVCHGELDLYTAPALRERMLVAIDGGKRHLVVDLTDVSFLDSTVMTVLIQRRNAVASLGGAVALVGVRDEVRLIFDIAGLDGALPMFDSRELAFDALSGS